jgi:hypothetical protein
MSNIKHNKIAGSERTDYREHLSRVNGNSKSQQASNGASTKAKANGNGNGRTVNTWDAYRNWLTKVQAPEKRRSLPDPALFSWKGYRSWAEKVRRDWETEELTNDS